MKLLLPCSSAVRVSASPCMADSLFAVPHLCMCCDACACVCGLPAARVPSCCRSGTRYTLYRVACWGFKNLLWRCCHPRLPRGSWGFDSSGKLLQNMPQNQEQSKKNDFCPKVRWRRLGYTEWQKALPLFYWLSEQLYIQWANIPGVLPFALLAASTARPHWQGGHISKSFIEGSTHTGFEIVIARNYLK